MTFEIYTFKEWGYPFIAQDYEGEVGKDCSNYLLGDVVFEDGDFEIRNHCPYLDGFAKIHDWIKEKVPAIMVELSHVNEEDREHATNFLTELLSINGYKDLQSYENRLAFGLIEEDK